ncbi:MAG: peptidoglycan DD-metalloendopeptidase family protein [Acidobacteria bacterium]|nr:peptidoglycan DD-metalloendopeptidase family protein [Acidobacteriota bacterium]
MVLALLLSSLYWWPDQAPKNEKELNEQIDHVDRDLDRLRQAISNFTENTEQVSDEVGRLELQRAILSSEVERAELKIQLADSEKARIEQQRTELLSQAKDQELAISSRLRQIYKRGNLGYVHVFLSQSKLESLLSAFHYAKYMTERDHQAFLDYRNTYEQLGLVESSLADVKAQAEAAHASLSLKRGELDHLLKERTARLNALKRQRNQKIALARELELQREELDMMIKRLRADDPDAADLRVPVTRYRGHLDWPASGPILRAYGVLSDPEFNTKRRQKGVDIKVDIGTPVTAVYSGQVIFADWFKSYGNLVIVDHGENVTSFYAHNERLLVKKGDFVERNTEIARSGDTGSLEGPFLHFEIRSSGTPENPNKWLKKK